MHKGYAYVSLKDIEVIAKSQFREKLIKELYQAKKQLPTILRDDRLCQMLMNLTKHESIDFNFTDIVKPVDSDKIRLSDLEYHSRKSFPPCMKGLFAALKNQHHLKHFGRLQLGLFLKGIGLSVDESLQFWRQELTKKAGMDTDKFEKNYAYNIKHMFGQEGKRNDYKPWSCSKVIGQQNPGTGEFHGCAFKTYGEDNLRQILSTYGLNSSDMNIVLDKKKEGLFEVACLRLFEHSHKNAVGENVGNHPNAFFNSSVRFLRETEKKKSSVPAANTNKA